MQAVAIVGLCILSAVVYGVLHDQVTARVCVEYFTIGHPPIFATDSPTLLGLGWGILATWWVGLLLGIPLALVARLGRRPPALPRSLVRPLAILFGVTAVGALLAGFIGRGLAQAGVMVLLEPLASRVPADRHVAFITDLWAHLASYAVGFLGGIVVIVHTWLARGHAAPAAALQGERQQ